jgi:acetyltransferase
MSGLEAVFAPRHVAVIGASERPVSRAAALTQRLLEAAPDVALSLINPRHAALYGRRAFANLGALPTPADAAIVLTPWLTLPNIIRDLARFGPRLALVLSEPSAGVDDPVADLGGLKRLSSRAARAGVRLLGPAAGGWIRPALKINLSHAPRVLDDGDGALLSASPALFDLALDTLEREAIGIGFALDLGVDVACAMTEAIDRVAADPTLKSLKFSALDWRPDRAGLSALRALRARKPVLVLDPVGTLKPTEHAARRALFDRIGVPSTRSVDDWLHWQPLARSRSARATSNRLSLAALIEPPLSVEVLDVADPGALQRRLTQAFEAPATSPALWVVARNGPGDPAALKPWLNLPSAARVPIAWCGAGLNAERLAMRQAGLAVYPNPTHAQRALALDALAHALKDDARQVPPPLELKLPWLSRALPIRAGRSGRIAERELKLAFAARQIEVLVREPSARPSALPTLRYCAHPTLGPWLELTPANGAQVLPLPLDLRRLDVALKPWFGRDALAARWLRDGAYCLSELFLLTESLIEMELHALECSPFGLRVDALGAARGRRLAAPLEAPYPQALEEWLDPELKLRPIRAEDEPELQRGFNRLTPEEVRMRFHYPLKALTHDLAAELSQIDYDRQMAFVLTTADVPGRAPIFGVARLAARPLERDAEFAIVIGREYGGRGYGRRMLQKLIDHAFRLGLDALFGDVLNENAAMLGLAESLGFRTTTHPDEPSLKRVTLALR